MAASDLFTTVYEAICDYPSHAVNRSLAMDRWIRIDIADATLVNLSRLQRAAQAKSGRATPRNAPGVTVKEHRYGNPPEGVLSPFANRGYDNLRPLVDTT